MKSLLLVEIFWIALFPVSCLWMWAVNLRRRWFPRFLTYTSKLKVICVGNIHSGGSGKTPLVKLLLEKLEPESPVLLSRGYGGVLSKTGGQIDRTLMDGCRLYGDEPWMIANQLPSPIFVGKDRKRMLKDIERQYPKSLVVMDDGFQRLSIKKNISIICISAEKRIHDSYCLPLGELREPLESIREADAVVITPGSDPKGVSIWRELLKQKFPKTPAFEADLEYEGFFSSNQAFNPDPSQFAISFCAIASPQRFVSAVASRLPKLEHFKSFSDHHRYTKQDVEQIRLRAEELGTQTVITTDKDWFKVAPLFEGSQLRLVSLRQVYHLKAEFWDWLYAKLGRSVA